LPNPCEDLVTEDQIGTESDRHIITLKPMLLGTATWTSTNTLSFQPDKPLRQNSRYMVSVKMHKLYDDLSDDQRNFDFTFETKQQWADIDYGSIEPIQLNDLKKQRLTGTVRFNDFTKLEDVQKAVTINQTGNSDLNIKWENSDDGLNYAFSIEPITRAMEDSEFKIDWNFKKLGIDEGDGSKEFPIPGLNNFKMVGYDVKNTTNPHVVLKFSDPIQKRQNLVGLIEIDEMSDRHRFIIEGNEIKVYPSESFTGDRTITVHDGILNVQKVRLKAQAKEQITFTEVKPAVRLTGKGVILPNSKEQYLAFEAVNLNAIDVEIFKIFDNNILQFLQNNNLADQYAIERVGKIISQEKVILSNINPQQNKSSWIKYALDLKPIFQTDPGAIYQVRLTFKPAYSTYTCTGSNEMESTRRTVVSRNVNSTTFISNWRNQRYYSGWHRDRNNPCKTAYYRTDKFASSNVLASNIGLIAKHSGNNKYYVAASNILSAKPLSGTTIRFINYQQQEIGNFTTDGDGIVQTDLGEDPYFIIAEKGNDIAYLKLQGGTTLSMSRFDVGGMQRKDGLRGLIYGERGVWRPGDSVHLNFILDDPEEKLPASHPITLTVFDSRNQLQFEKTTSQSLLGLYALPFKTNTNAPTGNWRAIVEVGGAKFEKILKIETIKPNRLKINLKFDDDKIATNDAFTEGDLEVKWLHGAPAKNVRTQIDYQLEAVTTKFGKYQDFAFDDPARQLNAEPVTLYDENVDENGMARVKFKIPSSLEVPGRARIKFKTKAYEKGGDFSTDAFSKTMDYYTQYVGINAGKRQWGYVYLKRNADNEIQFVCLDKEGNPLANKTLTVGLYKTRWRWWRDQYRSQRSQYNSATHNGSLKKATIQTNANGIATYNVNLTSYGMYLIRACDSDGGHCTGTTFYNGWGWGDEGGSDQAALLNFNADKDKYKVGETVEVQIPTGDVGNILVTVEGADGVVETRWLKAKKKSTKFRFYATKEMVPNVYVHAQLIQPHEQTENDLPIRMYGTIPIVIEDPKRQLNPVVSMPEILEPEKEVTIRVKEKDGKQMAYSIAVVDEGLLDLTRFKTPDAYKQFNRKEALTTQTWDVYDDVMTPHGDIDRILSIGGDGEEASKDGSKKANRFKPVVKTIGPFLLKKNGQASHTIKMPNYVGSVRTMVIAKGKSTYGSAEVTTPVRKPLMVLATLPRVLGPGEQVDVPITVFAMEDKIKQAVIKVQSSSLLEFEGPTQKTISFDKPGEQLVLFSAKVKKTVGFEKFRVDVNGHGESAFQEIEINSRNPNPIVTNIEKKVLQAGETWKVDYTPPGMLNTNKGFLELSQIPPINMAGRLDYLIRYPHGCVEQTTSSGFPQLFVNTLFDISKERQEEVRDNVQATIDRLKNFQIGSGAYAYWPGDDEASDWGTNYAGHFILEAKKLGYSVPEHQFSRWVKYQQREAKNWTRDRSRRGYSRSSDQSIQAYRLYTLSLADKPAWGAMNRLLNDKDLSNMAKWHLAAAYAVGGKKEVARKVIQNATNKIDDYKELHQTYGSGLRDMAIILEAYIAMDNKEEAASILLPISKSLSSPDWHGTQTVAYALLGVGKYAKANSTGKDLKIEYSLGTARTMTTKTQKAIMQIDVQPDEGGAHSVRVTNNGEGIVYARLLLSGQPLVGDQKKSEKYLQMKVEYTTLEGKELNPSKLAQGTDFIAKVTVTNPPGRGHYNEMALSQIFPSGWEIQNSRMDDMNYLNGSSEPEYQDIRDDRVYTYFDIRRSSTHTFKLMLNAAYVGRYYHPEVYCEAMYDSEIHSRLPGRWVEVTSTQIQ